MLDNRRSDSALSRGPWSLNYLRVANHARLKLLMAIQEVLRRHHLLHDGNASSVKLVDSPLGRNANCADE